MWKLKEIRPSIRRKTRLALVAMIVPMLLMGGFGTWAVHSSSTKFEAAAEDQVRDSLAIIDLRDALITSEWWAMQYANEGKKRAKGRFLLLVPQIEENLDYIMTMDSNAELALARRIEEAWAVAGPSALKALAAPPGSTATAEIYPLEEFHPALEEAVGLLADLNKQSLEGMQADVRAFRRYRDQFIGGLGIALIAFMAIAALISRKANKLIHRPLSKLEEAALRFGDHDFDHRVKVHAEDELGRVANAFNAMAERVSLSQAAGENLQHQLRYQALHDSLTGLPNRALLSDRVNQAIQQMGRSNGKVGLLFLDIDDFKSINDTFGHETGDEVLHQVGDRLTHCIRAVDTVARLGGDEFAILLTDMANADDPDIVAARILEAMSLIFLVGETELRLRASIGISTSGDPEVSNQELLRQADVAMYAAKAGGKNSFMFFDEALDDELSGKALLGRQLRESVDAGELEAVFQPMVELATGRVVGAEALMRWNHPTEGRMAPARFLPLAEESGLICDLDQWMLTEACTRAAVWQLDVAQDLTICVNLSGRTLQRDELVDLVAGVLSESGLSPQNLVLEMTENVFVDSNAVWRLRELKGLGVRLAIDDFGTGYSSLSYLKHFPIDILKVDKSFVDDLGQPSEDGDLAKAIVMLADALHLKTIAEGIEREEQVASLIELGVTLGQGYFLAKPLSERDLLAMLNGSISVGSEVQKDTSSLRA